MDDKKDIRKKYARKLDSDIAEQQVEDAQDRVAEIEAMQKAREEYSLDATDEKILKLLIEYPSINKLKLAQLVGLSRNGLRGRITKPAFIKAMADLQRNGVEMVKELQDIAMKRMRKLIYSKQEKIALEASKFVLQPVFNLATVNVATVEEKIYRVQYGEGGQVLTSTELVEGKAKELSPSEMLRKIEQETIEGMISDEGNSSTTETPQP